MVTTGPDVSANKDTVSSMRSVGQVHLRLKLSKPAETLGFFGALSCAVVEHLSRGFKAQAQNAGVVPAARADD